MKNRNKTLPNCPLQKKLQSIHDAKQAINNSKMSETAKRSMMAECDREWNKAWRYHYEGKKGYEIVQSDPRKCIGRVLKHTYGLKVEYRPEHIYAKSNTINLMVVSPHKGTDYKWLLRVAPMANFDRWSNSKVIESTFDSITLLYTYLTCAYQEICQRLFESLSREVKEERERFENNE
jgi:hypothetical protein